MIHLRHQNTKYTVREYYQTQTRGMEVTDPHDEPKQSNSGRKCGRNNNDIAQAVPQSYVHASYRIKSMSHHQRESHHILR